MERPRLDRPSMTVKKRKMWKQALPMEKEKQKTGVNQICSVHCFVVFVAIHNISNSGPRASFVLYTTHPANSCLNPAVFYYALVFCIVSCNSIHWLKQLYK